MQGPGWDPKILKWYADEAKANNPKPQDYIGGLVLDEMKVQVEKNDKTATINTIIITIILCGFI